MADPALVRITHRNQAVPGPVTFCSVDSCGVCSSSIMKWEMVDLFSMGSGKNGNKHKPMSLVLEFGGYAPCCIRQSVPTVFWTK